MSYYFTSISNRKKDLIFSEFYAMIRKVTAHSNTQNYENTV